MVSDAIGPHSRQPAGIKPRREELLSQGPRSVHLHPSVFTFTRSCCRQSLLESGFSLWAAATIARPQRASTLAPYEDKWSFFCGWCGKRSIDPLKISVNQLAEFLLFLFHDKEFSPGTVAVIVLRSQLRLGASGARILVTMLHFRL